MHFKSVNRALVTIVKETTSDKMDSEIFFQKVNQYSNLSNEAKQEWAGLLKKREFQKGAYFITVGQIPKKVAFVAKGLFSQYFITDSGDTVIKYFFPEGRILGSIPATLTQTESLFAIVALEDSTVFEYDFREFKKLVLKYRDVAEFYINYLERHWVIEKEPLEVAMKNDTAAKQYSNFLKTYPDLVKRLKKHHIASYLGITPTQLSRIFGYSK
jgi:CRP-like cAMP-binding protein